MKMTLSRLKRKAHDRAVGAAFLVYQLVQMIWMPRMVYLAIAVLAAAAVYVALLALMKIEEVALLKKLL